MAVPITYFYLKKSSSRQEPASSIAEMIRLKARRGFWEKYVGEKKFGVKSWYYLLMNNW